MNSLNSAVLLFIVVFVVTSAGFVKGNQYYQNQNLAAINCANGYFTEADHPGWFFCNATNCQCGSYWTGEEVNCVSAAACCECGECSTRYNCCPCGSCVHGGSHGNLAAPNSDSSFKPFCCPCAGGNCFPGKASVSLENGQTKTMDELMTGDRVETVLQGRIKYSEVTTFLQKQQDVATMYLSITTLSNKTITLSESHLIYTRKTRNDKFNPKYANEVSINNEVLVREHGQLKADKVKEISKFGMEGAYVPLTSEGNIMVDGVLASCYASFDHDLSHFAMKPEQWFPRMMERVFGWNHGIQVYTSIAKLMGRNVMPDTYSQTRNDFLKK